MEVIIIFFLLFSELTTGNSGLLQVQQEGMILQEWDI